jgi:hypothetical protein
MRYFTPQLWIGFNSPRREAAFKTWDHRFKAYRKSLRKILPGLGSRARRFFRDILILHDGTLTRFEVGDRITNPAVEARRGRAIRRRVTVRMYILTFRGDRVYVLEYRQVTTVEVHFPGKLELFPVGMYPNFGDWGYDELTAPEKGLFRHEILFASGASIVVEFRDFVFLRKRAETRRER